MATSTSLRVDSFLKSSDGKRMVEVVANDRFISARDIATDKYVTITEQELECGDWVPVHQAAYEPAEIARLAHLGVSV